MQSKKHISNDMYGVSRIDDEKRCSHAWRVSLCRRGRRFVRNFSDKKLGGKANALAQAKLYRDELLHKYPPLTRKEFATKKRRNNKSGISGVYTYAKRFQLRDGSYGETWYWEANWPTQRGESRRAAFSVKRYGNTVARQMAIRARERGLQPLSGVFWASERGEVDRLGSADSHSSNNSVASSCARIRVA